MRKALLTLLVFAVAGCLSQNPNGGGGDGTGGSGAGGGAGGPGGGVIDPGCGKMTFPISLNQSEPNVMMVVDDSGSMKEPAPGGGTKWDALKSSVTSLVTKYSGKVNWGLSVFPHPGGISCDPGQVDIAVAPGNGPNIIAHLDPMTNGTIGGATPTESTLQAVQKSGGLGDKTRNNYVLLMTDGLPTCNQDGRVTPVVSSLYQAGIRTYVVGIGDGTQSDPQQLNDWAAAGHTALNAPTKYYQANNITQLTTAFDSILQGIASCTYQLAAPPSDPGLLVSYIDGTVVPTDAANGMTYDAGTTSITFHGSACDKVKAGGASKVDVIYGCPAPVIQ